MVVTRFVDRELVPWQQHQEHRSSHRPSGLYLRADELKISEYQGPGMIPILSFCNS
jgi:hypothetical protein